MKRIASVFLALILVLSCVSFSVMADTNENVVYLDDGYYIVYTVVENRDMQLNSSDATRTKTGSAIGRLYDRNDKLMASATVRGTFKYDGTSAEAVSSSYDYDIYASGWSLESGTSYCEGDTAFADVTFAKFLARDMRLIVTLTCSPTGVLS